MKFDINSMLDPAVYNHEVGDIQLIQTHISWVILTGEFAYKIKKPVNFGFLDFSTLDKRRHNCEQELRLNRHMAAAIYLEVVAIGQADGKPTLSGDGEVLEYAVKMVQFPQDCQLDHMLLAGTLRARHMEQIGEMIARFHQATAIADPASDFGSAAAVFRPVEENFGQLRRNMPDGDYTGALNALEQWAVDEFAKLRGLFEQRKRDGFVRACHGDMHLRNLLLIQDQPVAFDCIEFNPELRWIDVMSDAAFLVMDLHDHRQSALANRFLNTYLEITGDFSGLAVLPFYLCYRALVRAKVAALRLAQNTLEARENKACRKEFETYLALAHGYTCRQRPTLIIMQGASASGKSTISKRLLDRLGAIRIRSDVERKRLFKLEPTRADAGEPVSGVYSPGATRKTYQKLEQLAGAIIEDGYSVIVDAAFLTREQRVDFESLARDLMVPYIIVEIRAPAEVLRQRIVERERGVSDADIRILEHQLQNWEPLDNDEQRWSIGVNSAEPVDIEGIIGTIQQLSARAIPGLSAESGNDTDQQTEPGK